MELKLLFTGLLLFMPGEGYVDVYFLDAKGHTPRIDITYGDSGESTVIKGKTVEVAGMKVGAPTRRTSFTAIVPSINALSKRAELPALSETKLKELKLQKVRLTGGHLAAGGGTIWCQFTPSDSGAKSAGYATLSSVVTWSGTSSGIKVGGTNLNLKGATEVLFRNDMDDDSSTMNHFGEYFGLSATAEGARPIPCRGEEARIPSVAELEKSAGHTRAEAMFTVRLLRVNNPLLCPPVQQ